jgi:hypothetical protein
MPIPHARDVDDPLSPPPPLCPPRFIEDPDIATTFGQSRDPNEPLPSIKPNSSLFGSAVRHNPTDHHGSPRADALAAFSSRRSPSTDPLESVERADGFKLADEGYGSMLSFQSGYVPGNIFTFSTTCPSSSHTHLLCLLLLRTDLKAERAFRTINRLLLALDYHTSFLF